MGSGTQCADNCAKWIYCYHFYCYDHLRETFSFVPPGKQVKKHKKQPNHSCNLDCLGPQQSTNTPRLNSPPIKSVKLLDLTSENKGTGKKDS